MPSLVDTFIAGVAAPLVAIVVAMVRRFFPSTAREDTLKEAMGLVAFLDDWVKVPRTDQRMREQAEAAAHSELMRLLPIVTQHFYQRGSDEDQSRRWLLLRTPRTPLAWVPQLLFYFLGILLLTVVVGAFRGAKVEPSATAVWVVALLAGLGICRWLVSVVEAREVRHQRSS